jgi:hypothetical protein
MHINMLDWDGAGLFSHWRSATFVQHETGRLSTGNLISRSLEIIIKCFGQ